MERPAVSFRPSNLTAPDKSHRPPLCHPEQSTRRWRVKREMNDFSSVRRLAVNSSSAFPVCHPALPPGRVSAHVRGLSRTWVEYELFPMLSPPVYTYLQEKKKEGLCPSCSTHVRESPRTWAPVRGQGLVRKREICRPNERMTITSLGSPSRLFIRRKPRDLRFHFRGQRICRGRIASRLRFPINANRRFLFRFSRRFCTPEFKYRSVLAGLKPRSPGLKPGLASFSCASIQHAKISSASQPRPDT